MRVLAVDDDPGVRAALRIGLEAAGLGCDVAADGAEGLWRVKEYSYDVIVLDVAMPGMDGLEMCRRLRAGGDWTPVLLLTAQSATEDEVRGLDGGADDFLGKPFAFPVLLARVRALGRRAASTEPLRLTLGQLSLDPHSGLCLREGVPIDLTAREAAVLEALLRRPGRYVSAGRLLELIWGPDEDPAGNVVAVHVSALRRKVDRPFGSAMIESRRGLGYRVREVVADGC